MTTFTPDDSLLAHLRLVSPQVALVVLVDDTGSAGSAVSLDINNLVVICNRSNLGIAAALNIGIEEAARRGCEWILTLDDDTRVRNDYVDIALAFVASGAVPNLGIVALSRPRSTNSLPPNPGGYRLCRNIITSGSLCHLELFRSLHGYSEDLFIDLVDFDFCCRARKLGRSMVLLDAVGMEHRVGNSEVRSFLGRRTTIYHHSPFRLYYQARNVIVFARRHIGFDPLLCLFLLVDLLRLPAKAVLFEQDKWQRLRYIGRGFVDGLSGRLGRIA